MLRMVPSPAREVSRSPPLGTNIEQKMGLVKAMSPTRADPDRSASEAMSAKIGSAASSSGLPLATAVNRSLFHEARAAFSAAAPGWSPRTNCSTSSAKRDCIHPRVGIAEDELGALVLRRLDDRVRAGHLLGHFGSPASSFSRTRGNKKRPARGLVHALANGDRPYTCPLPSELDFKKLQSSVRLGPLAAIAITSRRTET
jgi:hypothetical protein